MSLDGRILIARDDYRRMLEYGTPTMIEHVRTDLLSLLVEKYILDNPEEEGYLTHLLRVRRHNVIIDLLGLDPQTLQERTES